MIGSADFSDRQHAVDVLLRWTERPDLFAEETTGANLELWQREALQALGRAKMGAGKPRITARSGHGVGKTFLEAVAINWFGICFPDGKIPCTAPSAHQLGDLLWGEIAIVRQMLMGRIPDIAREIEVKAEEVVWRSSNTRAFARTSRKENPDALQGFHAKHLLFVIDEASGVEEKVFEVAQGALSTPGALILMCGNPTRTSGYFHRAHTTMRDMWHAMKVGCASSSRVSPDYAPMIARQYGEASNIYRVRVLGEFPAASDDAVMSLELIEAAKFRDIRPGTLKPIWGVDVARFGDDNTAIAKRKGPILLEPVRTWRNKDTMQTAGLIKLEYDQTPLDMKPAEILVDVIGLGAGVADRLAEMGLPARGINVAESPAAAENYLRLRDELWFMARKWFEARACSIPDDEALIGELCGPLYKVHSSGKIEVESKADMKKRGLHSPDRADAFCLTFAGDPTAGAWGSATGKLDYSKSNGSIV